MLKGDKWHISRATELLELANECRAKIKSYSAIFFSIIGVSALGIIFFFENLPRDISFFVVSYFSLLIIFFIYILVFEIIIEIRALRRILKTLERNFNKLLGDRRKKF